LQNEDLKKIIDLRSDLIKLYQQLDAKHEPCGVIKQSFVARELNRIIKKIDKVLSGKVEFK
jgi:hypothetical protein